MAALTRLSILLTILKLCKSECVIDHRSLSQEWEKKLKKDLKCNYHWNQTPNKDNVTEVKVRFILKYFEMDSQNDLFTMYSWTSLTWKDPRLIWNATDYGGVDHIYFWSHEFWTPPLQLNNRIEDEFGTYYGECQVQSTGFVACVPRILDAAQCSTKMSDWPFDTQRCTLEYSIDPIEKNVQLISRGERAVSMIGAEYGPEWTIVDYEQENNVNKTVQLKITFVLERNGEALGAILILPSIILAILTTSTLLLDVKLNRLLLMIFAMMCQFSYLSEISLEIPKHSEDPPTILLFYRFSLLLNTALLVMTIFLMKIRNKESIPPPWVITLSGLILETHGKYLIWPRWETDTDMFTSESVNSKDVEVWNGLANIVNSVCFFTAIVLYSIMVPLFVPTQPPFH